MLLHAVTIFLSAFLLFLVQPVLAKLILPWFGGAAIVWTTCMVFFQLVLLLGYAYSHWITTRVGSAMRRSAIHIALLVASLAFLPIIPGESWKPGGADNPVVRILLLLFATVGLPYFLLSATSPLIQSWFAREFPGSSPYRLFALSNLASMLALLGYPLLFEPWLASPQQSLAWSGGYAAFVAVCAWLAWRSRALPPLERVAPATEDPGEPGPGARTLLVWLALAATGSVTLLAVSNHLTQNISAIPLLWVIPLAIYLLTFILCFEGTRWYRRNAYLGLLVWIVCVMAWFLADKRLQFEIAWQVGVFALGLYVVCMFCHGELARLRPGPRHLTLFYLVVSLGGVVGGVLVGIVAPLTLPGYLELEIALVAVALLALYLNLDRPAPVIATFAAMAAFTTGALAWRVDKFTEDAVLVERNFYGVLRVKEVRTRSDDPDTRYRSLVHGAILHGEQWMSEKYRRAATTYYKTTSGIGKLILALEGRPIKVGVIGLGAGTLATYGDADDTYRFYDINPAVARVAREQFTFLADSPATTQIVLGDARLSLEREAPQGFDVLAVDAFSGDSIPVHLITLEAVGAYLRHMKPTGTIAFHVSNRFLDLKPVLLAIAERHGLEYAFVHETGDDGGTTSDWVLLTRDKRLILRPEIVSSTEPVAPRPDWRLWTDAYNNLLQVWRR